MKYAALFRGLNIGGKNIVKMADLRQLLSDLGLYRVQTYLQSGNAVFESDLDETALCEKIQTGFAERFGFESNVIIRSADALRVIIEQLPFSPEEIAAAEAVDPQAEHLYVYFLDCSPEQPQVDSVLQKYEDTDRVRIGERELYLLCRQSIRLSKAAIHLSKIFDTATVRNWKSVCNICKMMTTVE